MKTLKDAFRFALAGLFLILSSVAQAATVTSTVKKESTNLSNLPLAVFIVAAVVVYLCNRPRVAVCGRAHRRTESSRGTAH